MNRTPCFNWFLFSFCFFSFSCSFNMGNYGSIVFALPEQNNRSVQSDGKLPKGDDFPETYTIKLTPNKGEIILKTGSAGESVFIDNLIPDDYEIIVEGSTETNFFHGKTNVNIKAGTTETAYITLAITQIDSGNPGEPEVPVEPEGPTDPDKPAGDKIYTAAEADPLIRAATGEQTFKVKITGDSDFETIKTAINGSGINALINLDISTSTGIAIPASAFFNCDKLKSITLNSNITTIGNQAFRGCTALTGITLPSGVKTLGNEVWAPTT